MCELHLKQVNKCMEGTRGKNIKVIFLQLVYFPYFCVHVYTLYKWKKQAFFYIHTLL
jgi:hypothetical protein